MRLFRYAAGAFVLILIAAALLVHLTFRASLPQIDGEIASQRVSAAALIERDAAGVPTIRAQSRRDLAFATGFAHAQDRFFQMDLMRRVAAGELAELLGESVLDLDKKFRIHGFRQVARQVIADASDFERGILDAYVAGVNAALATAGAKPWEYSLLFADPAAWRAEDSLLVAFSMYLNLNDSTGEEELARAHLRDVLPAELYAFLHPLGTEWDAPIVGGTWRSPPLPGPEVLDLRAGAARTAALQRRDVADDYEEKLLAGSNSWAVAGTHSKTGAALLANDMHLDLRLPHVWYRARLVVEGADEARDLVGVTLPGVPMIVVGSNGRVAWGYTNSYGDWTDLVVVEVDPQDAGRYLTAAGSQPFQMRRETILVDGEDPVTLEVRATQWGPVVNEDAAGRPLALAWTAHHPQATNLRMLHFETATNLEEILAAANRSGGPVQNFLAVDSSGRIAWTLMGQVPVRAGYDSTVPASWRDGASGWLGWRAAEEYPRVIDPASGRLWTANTRTIDAQTWLAFLGDGGYDLGARAAQIRDGLLALNGATAQDMVAIQTDDRALFMSRWRDLLLDLLDAKALTDHPLRAEAKRWVEGWSGRAAADDVGYRIVRSFRAQVRKDVFDTLTAGAREKFPRSKFVPSNQFEGPLWQLVTRRPSHLLDPRRASWEAALLVSFDAALGDLQKDCKQLSSCTWGAQNSLEMRHPLSAALPFATRWLDMPASAMSGDFAMPRVQGVKFGASQRLVVSPGREAEGFFQMPGGPVDHPLSEFYGAGHDAWVRGEPLPLLPGETQHTLRLTPEN